MGANPPRRREKATASMTNEIMADTMDKIAQAAEMLGTVPLAAVMNRISEMEREIRDLLEESPEQEQMLRRLAAMREMVCAASLVVDRLQSLRMAKDAQPEKLLSLARSCEVLREAMLPKMVHGDVVAAASPTTTSSHAPSMP
jgi:hypothetical protein